MVTVEVKSSDFHFHKKDYTFAVNMVQECLKHLSFSQNKVFKIVRFKCVKNSLQRIIFSNCLKSHLTHGGHIAKQLGNWTTSYARIIAMT